MTSLKERLGRVGVWMNPPADIPIADVRRAVKQVEALGYGAFWYAETPRSREALVQASLILDATDAIQVATGITSVYSRDAIALRNGANPLEEAHPGRFVLGVGVSHAPAVESRGHDYGKPVKTMRAYLEATGELDVPVVLAALRERMLTLARERSQGAHPYFTPVEHTRRARKILGPDPLLAPEVTVVLETDPDKARATARAFMHRYLSLANYKNNLLDLGYDEADLDPDHPSDQVVDDIVGHGDEAAIAARVNAHHEAGADHVCVQAIAEHPAQAVEQLERLAPHLLSGSSQPG